MSLGQGLGQGLMLAAQNVAQNRRLDKAEKRQLEMFNLKRVAAVEDFQKMEEIKDNLTSKKRQRNLDLLTAKYGNNNAIPQPNTAIPSSEPISGNGAVPLPMPSSPVQGQINLAQTAPKAPPAMFNLKDWQSEHYQDYIDPDSDNPFDEKGFRQGSENASKEAKKFEQNKALVTSVAKQYGMKFSPEELDSYASNPSMLLQIQNNNLAKKRFASSEAHRIKSEANADARLAKYLAPKVGSGGGGHGRSGGGSGGGASGGGASGYKQTRDGNFVKVDKRGNPTGQIIRAEDAYNMGITNTAPQRRPRAVQGRGGGGTAELIRQQLNSIKGFD
jgi:hypothetical protein